MPRDIEINADYGIISLFDGVSTVVPTLQNFDNWLSPSYTFGFGEELAKWFLAS